MINLTNQLILAILVFAFFYDFFNNQNVLKFLKDIVAIYELSNVYLIETISIITSYKELSASFLTGSFLIAKNSIQVCKPLILLIIKNIYINLNF